MGHIIESQHCVESAKLWFIMSVLIDNYLPTEYKDLLGPIPSLKSIPVRKTIQQPACAMHIKASASSTDGNVDIIENME